MFIWDEELKPVLQRMHVSDTSGSRLPVILSSATESVRSGRIKVASRNVMNGSISKSIQQARRWLGTGFIMTSRISQAVDRTSVGEDGLRTRIHGAGIKPNTMDHFMQSNACEVLFVI